MAKIAMTFDELLTLRALKFKSELTGQANSGLLHNILENDGEAASILKNLCFRIDPVLQARLESVVGVLGISKQQILTEALQEMLNRFEDKLEEVGVGKIDFKPRLRELGYELGKPDEQGFMSINRLDGKGG